MRKFLLALFTEQIDHEWRWYCNHKQLGRSYGPFQEATPSTDKDQQYVIELSR